MISSRRSLKLFTRSRPLAVRFIKQADKLRPTDEGYDPRTLYIPKSAWSSFTPFETQFWEIKQNHYDTVLFFQKGKFFELVSCRGSSSR